MVSRRRSPEEVAKSMSAAKAVMAKEKLNEYTKNIKYARNALLIVGIIQVLFGLYEGFGPMKFMEAFYIDAAIGGIFIGLFFYAKENAKTAFIVGLFIYVAIILLVAVGDPASIFKGLILKTIVISTLVGGLRAVGKVPKKIIPNDELLDEVNDPLSDL